jgi:voltage-gated sodium channel
LEGWVDIMTPSINVNPLYGFYFISFIITGTFIVINIFVAVIVRKSEDAYKQIEIKDKGPITQNEILLELIEIKKKIELIETKLSDQ